MNTDRITLTLPVLNNAANVVFLVCGAGKAQVMHDVFSANNNGAYPASSIHPTHGRLLWIVDRDAASLFAS